MRAVMSIDLKETARVAALAHLEFDDEGLRKIAADLGKILEYIDQLKQVETSGVTATESLPATPLADDVASPSLPLAEIEANAPAFAHRHFVVPKVIGGES